MVGFKHFTTNKTSASSPHQCLQANVHSSFVCWPKLENFYFLLKLYAKICRVLRDYFAQYCKHGFFSIWGNLFQQTMKCCIRKWCTYSPRLFSLLPSGVAAISKHPVALVFGRVHIVIELSQWSSVYLIRSRWNDVYYCFRTIPLYHIYGRLGLISMCTYIL